MKIKVAREALETILAEAALAGPVEVCGLLLGSGQIIAEARPAGNIAPDPVCHFEIDPRALFDAHRSQRGGGPQLLGYYHSHPNGRAEPSPADRAMAAGDGMVWAIAACGKVSLWRDGPDGFEPLPYIQVDR